MNIVIATSNKGKVKEIENILRGIPVDVLPVTEFGKMPDVDEDAPDFLGNALKKARAVSELYNVVALADDSGLEVDALDGAPGVLSARYAGPDATDALNNNKLLEDMADIPEDKRSARFRCTVVLYHPDGQWISADGVCEGMIALEPKGDNGFGYDPLFFLPDLGKTMAELAPDQKNLLSHRYNALIKLKDKLMDFLL